MSKQKQTKIRTHHEPRSSSNKVCRIVLFCFVFLYTDKLGKKNRLLILII